MVYEVGSRYPKPGEKVKIIQKKDYVSGNLTLGIVKDVLTKKQIHPRGHKVRLTNGIIGRVQKFADQKEDTPEFSAGNATQSDPDKPAVEYKPSEDDLV